MKILLSIVLLFRYLLFSYDFFEESYKEDIYRSYQNYYLKQPFTPLDDDLYTDYTAIDINLNNLLDQKEKNLFTNTLYLQVFMVGTVGFLYLMPSSFTNWEDNGDRDLVTQYKDHIHAGPVWDKDDFAINYIGHPVSGAWYYMIARENGFGEWESFVYSFALSTLFWEYGYEAFAEIPSTQDLIFTPTLGAILGEGFYRLQNRLDANKGVIFGSKTLGDIAYFFLNPIKRITDNLDNYFDVSMEFHYTVLKSKTPTLVNQISQHNDYVPSNYGFIIDIDF